MMLYSAGTEFSDSYSYVTEKYINVNLISEIEPNLEQVVIADKIYKLSRTDFANLMRFLHI